MDTFLELFGNDFEEQTVAEARRLEGPHVYLVVSPSPIKYSKGTSFVSYIGYTDVPRTRFASHTQIGPRDNLLVTQLQPILREVKQHYADWSQMSEREHRAIREHAERLFIYLFHRLLGAIPIKNSRRDMPTKEAILVAEFLLKWKHSQRAVTNAAQAIEPLKQQLALIEHYLRASQTGVARSSELVVNKPDRMTSSPVLARPGSPALKAPPLVRQPIDRQRRIRPNHSFDSGEAIVRTLRAYLPRHLRRDEAANGATVFVDSDGLQRLMIYEYGKHCQIRIRCARDWGNRRCPHRVDDRNSHGWLSAVRVENSGDLKEVLALYETEWGLDA